jgi:hypothetical protein
MAGSLTWRKYISDDGQSYAFKVDESNARARFPSGGGDISPVRDASFPPLPRSVIKRYLLAYNQANPLERRKFYIGDRTLVPNAVASGATLVAEDYPGANDAPGANVTWVITAYRGEKINVIPAITAPDTGLTDGTPGQ